MSAICPFKWRRMCVKIEDIYVKVPKDLGAVIEVPRYLRFQGTRPSILTTMFSVTLMQGGYWCDHIIKDMPQHGTILKTDVGWYFICEKGYTGMDFFTYYLVNMGQSSKIEIVTIEIA